MRISDWSSDVCSSDLAPLIGPPFRRRGRFQTALRNIVAPTGCNASRRGQRSRPARLSAKGFAMLRSFLFATLSAVALTTASLPGPTANAEPNSAQWPMDIHGQLTIPNKQAQHHTHI